MKRVNGVLVELQERFAAGANHEWTLTIRAQGWPATCDCFRKIKRCAKLATARTIYSDKIGIAETADGGRTIRVTS